MYASQKKAVYRLEQTDAEGYDPTLSRQAKDTVEWRSDGFCVWPEKRQTTSLRCGLNTVDQALQ